MKIEILQPQGINEIGNRQNQEDSLFPSVELATADDRLFMVCDGMGGHEHGEVAFDEMQHYDRKNVITRAIMPGMERQPKLDIAHTTDLQPGDYFLLCSDGLLERMDDGQLLQQLSTNSPDEDKRRQIVIETEKNADNHSAWLIHIKSVTQESDDAQQKNDEATVRCNAMRYETAAIEKQSSLFSRLKKWLQ